jgi:FtsP/CotA-like multicopper oxidase with cupredoxin domain
MILLRVLTGGLLALVCAGAFGATRTYYIAADEVIWDFAPSGINQIYNRPFNDFEAYWTVPSNYDIGRRVKKAIYREYTDGSFAELKPRPAQWEHLGILGPLVRAEVGDTIKIVFKNNTSWPTSLHPHGVFYQKDSEGAPYEDGTKGAAKQDDGVPTGAVYTYTWEVPERAGPVPGGPSTAFWMYHSHINEVSDVNAGLMAPMIITAKGAGRPDGSPKDVDREFVVAFYEFLEIESRYAEENIASYMLNPDGMRIIRDPFGAKAVFTTDDDDEAPVRTLIRETLNGYYYGNLPMLTMNAGEKVRWYIMGTTNFEVHAPHWHGNTFRWRNMNADTIALLTMGMETVDMQPDNPGIWLFHCHVGVHFEAGMVARYRVLEPQ